jgi:hypothetical protein
VPIKLQCVCGKVLNLPDSLARQKIRCKDCDKVLTVPEPEKAVSAGPARVEAANPLAIRGHRRCGRCGRSYPQTDKVCTKCGIDMDTGAALYVSLDADGEGVAAPPPSDGLGARLLRLLGLRKGP